MEHLPTELIDAILEHVSSRDQKTLRRTCRMWANAVAPHLFPRLWLSSHPLDVQVFRTVLRNPLICRGVRELIWDDTTYCDSLLDRGKYMYWKSIKQKTLPDQGVEHSLKLRVWGSSGIEQFPIQEFEDEEIYKLFLAKARLHHHIRRRRIDEKLLVKALPLLPNLKSVVLSNRHHDVPFPDGFSDVVSSPTARLLERQQACWPGSYMIPPTVNWKTTRKSTDALRPETTSLAYVRRVDYHEDVWNTNRYRESCTNQISIRDESDDTDDKDDSRAQVSRPFRGLLILLRALSGTNSEIQSFEIRPQYSMKCGANNNAVGISSYFFRENSTDLDHFITIARGLRKLHLVISCEGSSSQSPLRNSATMSTKTGHLTRLLQSAERLEELHFELPTPDVMSVVGSQTKFPHLRKLALMQGVVEPLELVDFLKTHRATLQALSLSHCNSTTVSWKMLFRQMREESLHMNVYAYYLFEPDRAYWCQTMEQEGVQAFFMGKGDAPLIWFHAVRAINPPWY